jgi:hypothetical protein
MPNFNNRKWGDPRATASPPQWAAGGRDTAKRRSANEKKAACGAPSKISAKSGPEGAGWPLCYQRCGKRCPPQRTTITEVRNRPKKRATATIARKSLTFAKSVRGGEPLKFAGGSELRGGRQRCDGRRAAPDCGKRPSEWGLHATWRTDEARSLGWQELRWVGRRGAWGCFFPCQMGEASKCGGAAASRRRDIGTRP